MEKKKTIVDETIDLVNENRKKLEKEILDFHDVSDDISLIKRVFPKDDPSFSNLKNVSSEDFDALISKIYDGSNESVIKILKASYFIINNDIDLYDSQIEKLNEFIVKVESLKIDLDLYSERFHFFKDSINKHKKLVSNLGEAKEKGILDVDILDSISTVLGFDESAKAKLLNEALKFNLGTYKQLGLSSDLVVADEVENGVLENEVEKKGIDLDDLRETFEKYGYNLDRLDTGYVEKLQKEGNLENIESVFKAVSENKLYGLNDDRRNKLLTQFLLYSNAEIINNVCEIFRKNHCVINLSSGQRLAFFPNQTIDVSIHHNVAKGKQGRENGGQSTNDNIEEVGRYDDFIKNWDYLTNNLEMDHERLLSRGIAVLTLPHNVLLKRIGELELYGYDLSKASFAFTALTTSKIMEVTDSFIERGEELYIKRNASRLITSPKDIVDRIYAYQKYGYNYHSDSHDGSFKTYITMGGDGGKITEETIKETVPRDVDAFLKNKEYKEYKVLLDKTQPVKISNKTLSDPVIVGLDEKYKISESMYKIDDIIISRKKVLRNYEFLMNTPLLSDEDRDTHKLLLVSTVNNSLLTSSEIENVDRKISEVVEVKGGNNEVLKK